MYSATKTVKSLVYLNLPERINFNIIKMISISITVMSGL